MGAFDALDERVKQKYPDLFPSTSSSNQTSGANGSTGFSVLDQVVKQKYPDLFSSGSRLHRNQDSDPQSQWLKKYQGKGYKSLADSLLDLEEGDEKEWLKSYAQGVDYDEKKNLDLKSYEAGILELQKQYDSYKNAKQGSIQAAEGKTEQETLMDLLKQTGDEIDRRKQYLTLARRIQEQAAGDERYSQVVKNADFAQKSGFDSGNQEIGYQYMNADAAGKLDLEQKYGQYAKQWSDRGYDSLSEEEKAVYNYYMNTGDREEAARYLKYLEETLQIRKGTEADAYVDKLVEDDPRAKALRYAFMANVGLDQNRSGMEDLGHMIAGNTEYRPVSATQYAGQLMREDLGNDGKKHEKLGGVSTGQMVGDIISTTANMAPSILTSSVLSLLNPGLGATTGKLMMSGSAAGSGYREMINEGYSKEQAQLYGLGVGAAEYFMESALGGISKLGGVPAKALTKWAENVDNALLKFALQLGGSGISEGMEEGLTDVVTGWLKSQITHEDFYAEPADVLYSSLLGAATGVLFEGPDAAVKSFAKKDGAAVAENATTEKSTAVDDKMSAAQLTEDIDSFAKQYGKQAEAVKQTYLEGQDLKEYQAGFQAAYAIGKDGGKKDGLQQVPYLSQSQKEIAFSMGQYASALEKRDAEKAKTQKMPKATLMTEDGESSSVSIAEVVSMDDNAMTFRLSDGSTVTDEALTFDKGDQVLSAVWESGMDVKAANAILADMETNPATDAAQAAGIDEAYRYGSHGYSMEQLLKNGADASALTAKQRQAAYDAGVNARQAAAVAAPAAKAKKGTSVTGVYLDGGSGNVTAFSQENLNMLSGKRKSGVMAAMALHKVGVGGSFYFYESYVNDAGERVYKDANGVEKKAPNGWYDPSDDSIHIDLNAGGDASGMTLYTLSHELTHFVEKRSKKKYQALADFLAKAYGKHGASVDQLVIAKQKELSEIRGEAVTYDEAYSEFIADSMEAMLSDGNVLEKLADLKAKDRGLFDEIRKFFDNVVKKIREFYNGLQPDSDEGRMVMHLKDQIEQIQQLFAEALADASENYQAAADTDPAVAGAEMSNEEAFQDSATAVHFQIRPPYADGSKAFNAFVDDLNPEARKTFDLFYGFYQRSRITNTVSVSGKKVKAVNISALYLLAQDWNSMLAKEPKWAAAAKELADFLPADVRRRMNMNDDGTLNPTTMEREFKMPSSMAQRLVDALPYEGIDAEYKLGDKTVTLPDGKARQSVGGEAYRRVILDETRKLFSEGKLKPVGIGTMSKDRWGSLGFLAANGKTGASGDFTTVCPQMMFNRGCWYCYRRAAMEKGVNNKLVANSVWYTGEILRIKQSDIDALNRNGGLRIQSFGDWMPHFSAMLADVLYDAELRGLQVKIITKEPSMINYIAALRDQGIGKNLYFNLSADYTIERGPAKQAQDGNSLDAVNPERPYMRDADNSFWWKRAMTVEEAAKYREKYPWVNTRIVATDVAEFIRGLKDNRVDVVTGYHGNIRGIERIDSTTGIRKIEVEALGDAGMPRFAFNPVTGKWVTEYEGKTATHKRLAQAIADNGLQMEYYTKTCCITGRCATCEGKCGALARDFNVKNATNRDTQSIAYWQKQMEYAVEPEFGDLTVDRDKGIKYSQRKYAPGYKASEEDAKYLDAVNRGDDRTAQRMVRAAAKKAGYDSEKLFHGSPSFGFTWFDMSKMDDGISIFATSDQKVGESYSGPTDRYLISDRELKNVQDMDDGEVLKYVQRYIDPRYQLSTKSQREKLSQKYKDALDALRKNFAQKVNEYSDTLNETAKEEAEDAIAIVEQMVKNIGNHLELDRLRQEFSRKTSYLIPRTNRLNWEAGLEFEQTTEYILDTLNSAVEVAENKPIYVINEADYAEHLPVDVAKEQLQKRTESGIYGLYAKTDNLFDIDAHGNWWSRIPGKLIGRDGDVKTRDVADYARTAGYNGVKIRNLIDPGGRTRYQKASDVYIFFDNSRVKSADPVTYDDDGNVIPLSERFKAENQDLRYSERDTESVSNRSLLANSFEQLAQKPDEREFLQKYRENAAELDKQEAKLQELRRQIREISFGKGPRDTQKLKALQEEATKTANRIDIYDKRLLGLEATVPLKRVLEREKAKVKQKADADKKAAMEKFREETKAAYEGVQSDAEIMEREFLRLMRAYEKQSADTAAKAKKTQKAMDKKQATIDSYKEDLKTMEREFLRVMKGYETAERKNNAFWEGEFKRLMREYEASGRKVDRLEAKVKAQREAARANVDSRRRTVLRNKIRKDIRELQKILDKGNKKRNVKQGMQDFVSKTIATGEILFADLASDTDLIASGIQADMTTEERKLLTEAERYVRQIEELEDNEHMADVLKARQEGYAEVLKQLKPVLERERIRINSTEASKAFDSLVEAYRSLKESADSYIAMAFNPEVLEYLEGIKYKFAGTLVRDMSQAQLQTLHDCYKMVMTTIRNVNKAFVDGRSVQADAEQLVQEFQERKVPVKKMGVVLKNLSDAAGWNYEKLYYALERINSPTLKRLFGNLANSENITMRDVQEAKAFQKEMVEKYHYNDWDVSKKMEQTFLDSNGKEFHLTLGELMALYAYSRTEDADRHIEVGGFTFGETALTDPNPAATYKLTADQVSAISDLLTPEQKSFAEAMQRYLSKNMGAKGNEVSMKLYGIEMFNEENYFPLHVAGEYKAKAQESQARANAGFQSMSNAGFTKARNTNATAPIVLEDFMSVWADHVNEMSRYHGAVPALEDIRRVMNYSVYSDAMAESVSVTAAMTNAYGKQAVKYFDDLYREANRGAVTDRMDAASKKMLSLFRKNSVAYSASVVIQQPTSIFRAKAMIDGKYFGAHGMFTLTGGVLRILNRKKWNAAYADMMKYAPGVTMAKEIGGFDTSTGSSIRSYLLDTDRSLKQSMKHGTAKEKAGELMGLVDDNFVANLPNVADKVAWIEIWEACRRETAARNPKMETSSEAFKQKVGDRFTEVIRATQVYDSMFSKSPLLKSRNLGVQYVVSFMNEPNTVANMAEQAVRDIANKDFRKAGKAVGALTTSIVATNLLKSIIYAMRDDDEDETFREKYLSAVAGNLMSDGNLLNYIPIARDIWSIWEGYDVERSDMAIAADVVDAIQKLRKLNKEDIFKMTEEELEAWDKKVMDAQWRLAETLAPVVGIPLKNIRREILAVINTINVRELDKSRKSTELSIRHAIEEATGKAERSDRDKLYEALVSGDQDYVKRLKAGYEDEAAYHNAIRMALRDHESRIWEAAIAWNQDNLGEYLRIGEEIAEEGHFDYSDIYAAIQSEANSMVDNESGPAKVKGKFNSEKFGVAMGQNNTAMADIIQKDLVDTKIANGKTREEAQKAVQSTARSQLKELYELGEITGAVAQNMLVRYGGYDRDEAKEKVAEWKYEADHPELDGRITYGQYKRWEADGKSRGVSLESFTKVTEYRGGETSDGVRSQEEVAAYINAMPISTAQKDALWLCFWSEKTLYKNAPWHN